MKTAIILIATVFTFGCGYGSNYKANPMTTPAGTSITISDLSPDSDKAAGAAFVMTVNGSGFGMDSTVYFNSVAHSTSYVTGSQLTTSISASDIASPGTIPVYVRSNNMNSNTMNFTVN